MDKFEAAKYFLKYMKSNPQDFGIGYNIEGNTECFLISHKSGISLRLGFNKVTNTVEVINLVNECSLNLVDPDTCWDIISEANIILNKEKEQRQINADNNCIEKIIRYYDNE